MDEIVVAQKQVKEALNALAKVDAVLERVIAGAAPAAAPVAAPAAAPKVSLGCTMCFRPMPAPFRSPMWNGATGRHDYQSVTWCADCDRRVFKVQ